MYTPPQQFSVKSCYTTIALLTARLVQVYKHSRKEQVAKLERFMVQRTIYKLTGCFMRYWVEQVAKLERFMVQCTIYTLIGCFMGYRVSLVPGQFDPIKWST